MVPATGTRPTHSSLSSAARQHAAASGVSRSLLGHIKRHKPAQQPALKPVIVPSATRDKGSRSTEAPQVKLRPGDYADRADQKTNHLAAATDWQTVIKLFYELGDNIDRNVGLIGDMLVSLQRLAPAAAAGSSPGGSSSRLSPEEANLMARGTMDMCNVLVDNIARVSNKLLINMVWALALLPDPTKTITTPAAAAARARHVGVFGAAVLNRFSKYTAEEVFHVGAGLAMLGFKPPRTLQSDRGVLKTFGSLIERRTTKVMHYLSPKAIADAGFVAARLVAPGDMSAEWLKLFAYVSKQQLGTMQPEGIIYSGYALARHGCKPSNTWRKRYMDAIYESAKTLAGEEFPMVLYTLAKWQQQQQQAPEDEDDFLELGQQQQWSSSSSTVSSTGAFVTSSSGPAPSQALINNLLLGSHINRALKQLPLNQLVVMLKSLTELECEVSPMWMQRVWPAVNAQIDAAADAAAAGSSVGFSSSLAALITAIPRVNPKPDLPADLLDIVVGNLGVGLNAYVQHNARELVGVLAALQQLGYNPDQIFMRQLQQAVVQGVAKVPCKDMDALLQIGLTAAGSSDSSSSDAGEFLKQLLESFCTELEFRIGLVTGAALLPAAAAAGVGGQLAVQQQQLQQQRQQLLSTAAAQGLWRLPQVILASMDHITAAAASAAAATGSSDQMLDNSHTNLQQIWRSAAVGLAGSMPTEPLLILLNNMLDLEDNSHQQQQLGLAKPSDRQQVTLDILESGVYRHISGSSSGSSIRGKKAAGSSSSSSSGGKDLMADFSVADWQELLVIIADAGLQDSVPDELLTLSSEALHKALSELPKVKVPTENMTEDELLAQEADLAVISNFITNQYVDDLVVTLKQDYGYNLPAKVKSKYKSVKQLIGQDMPPELMQRRGGRKAAASSSSKMVQGTAAAAAGVAQIQEPAVVLRPATAAAAAAPVAAAAAAVMSSVDDGYSSDGGYARDSEGIVRSNRGNSRSPTGTR